MGRTERKRELLTAYKERPTVGGVCAVRCTGSGRVHLFPAADPAAQRNRFTFSVSTGSCLMPALAEDWAEHGPESFTFEVLEELEKKPDQEQRAFLDELSLLAEIWREKLAKEGAVFYAEAAARG